MVRPRLHDEVRGGLLPAVHAGPARAGALRRARERRADHDRAGDRRGARALAARGRCR